jgi:hypothetical protein
VKLLLLLLAGCSVGDRYLISGETARALSPLSAKERAATAVEATRKKDGKRAFVRGSAVELNGAKPAGDRLDVWARVPSRMVVAGQALTWIGTGISVAGTIVFFSFRGGEKHWLGGGIALGAETVMLTGTGLWIAGQLGHPQEVPPGRAGLRYLPP